MHDERALILTLIPFKFGTRARKAATALAPRMPTRYLALARVGRTGLWDSPRSWVEDEELSVHQVPVAAPRTEPRRGNQIRNIAVCYVPAFFKLALAALTHPAQLVIINGTSLLPLGLMHRLLFRSRLILDINERPGQVHTRGSVASYLSRIEIPLLRVASRHIDTAMVVTYADVEAVRALGFRKVVLVRNVPKTEWRAPYEPPPFVRSQDSRPLLRAVAMGSIYEGRGYELLIRGVSLANKSRPVQVTLCGPGRDSYMEGLRELAAECGVAHMVTFIDRIDSVNVSRMYLKSDVGMVLYEGHDPGNDGLSNKLFECVCSGRPVIASDLPENRRFVTETGVGWLTDNTPEDLARKLISVADRRHLDQIATHCRTIGDQDLHWDREFLRVVAPHTGA